MIYKVFYQETKERSPRRETTRAQSTISSISNSCLTNC